VQSITAEPKFSYLFGEFYKLISINGTKLTALCQNCPKVISGSTSSSGNLLSHIKVSFSKVNLIALLLYNVIGSIYSKFINVFNTETKL